MKFPRIIRMTAVIGLFVLTEPSTLMAAERQQLLVLGVDTSGSVRKALPEAKAITKDIIQLAPANVSIGLIEVQSRAEAHLFLPDQRRQARTAVDGFLSGPYTDLDYAVAQSQALMQQTGAEKTVVVFVTDGEISLPKGMTTSKAGFLETLRKAFGNTSTQVIVLKIGGKLLAGMDTLPVNIKVESLENWAQAEELVKQGFGAKLVKQFQSSKPPLIVTPPPPDQDWIPALILGAFGLAALYLMWIRSQTAPSETKTEAEKPEDHQVLVVDVED